MRRRGQEAESAAAGGITMGQFLLWLLVRFLMAIGIVVSAAVVCVGILAIAAVLMAAECDAVELRRVRELEAAEEAEHVDVEA